MRRPRRRRRSARPCRPPRAPPGSASPRRRPSPSCAVAVDPVNAILSTPERHSAAPTSPRPCTACSTGCSGTTSANVSTSHCPTAGVYSLGLRTTALPAASAPLIGPERGQDRVVPRADHADHAVRLVLQVAGVLGEQQPGLDPARAEHPPGVAGAPSRCARSRRCASTIASATGLPVSGVGERGQLLDPLGEQGPPAQQPGLAPVEAEAGPPGGGRPGPLARRRRPRPASATGTRPASAPVAGLVEMSRPSSITGMPGVRVAVMNVSLGRVQCSGDRHPYA